MRVSVIIPVHNAEPYLDECLQSVLAQDYQPLEIIAVDNNSTDRSLRVLRSYEPRVAVLQERRAGCAAARNAGLRAATGDIIAFNDADDVWLPGRISTHVDYLRRNPQIGVVFGQFADWYPDSAGKFASSSDFLSDPAKWHPKGPLSGWIYADALLFCPIAMITPTLRREVVDVVGNFDESLVAGSDYEFWLRVLYQFQAHLLPGCVAAYRHHGSGITSSPRPYSSLANILERTVAEYGLAGPDGRAVSAQQMSQRLAEIWLQHGLLHLRQGSLRVGFGALWRYSKYEDSRVSLLRNLATGMGSVIRTRLISGRYGHRPDSSSA